jgi:hypothetical protein
MMTVATTASMNDEIAGCGPCGRPHPGWHNGYPAMADGHKGRTLQNDKINRKQ